GFLTTPMRDECLECLQLLAREKGAKLFATKDKSGEYPLHHAIRAGAMGVIKWMLLELKVDEAMPLDETPNPRWHALELAAQNPEILRFLVKQRGWDLVCENEVQQERNKVEKPLW